MTWDAFQREMLSALGHTLYVVDDSPATRGKGDAGVTMPERHMPDRPAIHRSTTDRSTTDRSTTDRSTTDRNATSLKALMGALLRAANLGDDNVATLQSQLPSLHTLAGNANAKRALWPMLRAMRAASKVAGRDPPLDRVRGRLDTGAK